MTTNEPFDVIPVPLVEAVIEVRFPGDVEIERRQGEFRVSVRSRYPDLLLPRVAVGDSVATSPTVFAAADRTSAVLLGVDLLGCVVQAYPGWEAFRGAFLEHWEGLTRLVPLQRANRVALRYVNRFPGPLADAVRTTDPPPFLAPLSSAPLQYEGSTRIRTRRGHVAHVHVRHGSEGDAGLLLDLDVARDGLEDLASMADVLHALHADVEELFLASLAPLYAASLVGSREDPDMTRALEGRPAVGDAPHSLDVRTLDLETVLGQVAVAPLQRSQVRNVLLRARGSDAPAWSARAAFDASQRNLVSLTLAPAGGERPVEADLVVQLVERRLAFVEAARDAATERGTAVAGPTAANRDGSELDAAAGETVPTSP